MGFSPSGQMAVFSRASCAGRPCRPASHRVKATSWEPSGTSRSRTASPLASSSTGPSATCRPITPWRTDTSTARTMPAPGSQCARTLACNPWRLPRLASGSLSSRLPHSAPVSRAPSSPDCRIASFWGTTVRGATAPWVSRSTAGDRMRRVAFLALALALTMLLCLLSPLDALAQAAPAQPTFAITGFIDSVGTWTQNFSSNDLNFNQNRDHQLYGRSRGRFDIVGQVGEVKAVFGFEIDAYWGQTGFIDSNQGPGCVTASGGNVTCGATGAGAESSFDLNTD